MVFNNNLIICYSCHKLDDVSTGTKVTYTFPIAYTTSPAVLCTLGGVNSNTGSYAAVRYPHDVTTTTFVIVAYKAAQRSWMSIGF